MAHGGHTAGREDEDTLRVFMQRAQWSCWSPAPQKPAHKHAPVEHKQHMFVSATLNRTAGLFTAIQKKKTGELLLTCYWANN